MASHQRLISGAQRIIFSARSFDAPLYFKRAHPFEVDLTDEGGLCGRLVHLCSNALKLRHEFSSVN
jgi:hypothetical protein